MALKKMNKSWVLSKTTMDYCLYKIHEYIELILTKQNKVSKIKQVQARGPSSVL